MNCLKNFNTNVHTNPNYNHHTGNQFYEIRNPTIKKQQLDKRIWNKTRCRTTFAASLFCETLQFHYRDNNRRSYFQFPFIAACLHVIFVLSQVSLFGYQVCSWNKQRLPQRSGCSMVAIAWIGTRASQKKQVQVDSGCPT